VDSRGFTLIELLLSVLIIGMLVGLSMPVYMTFQSRNDLDISAQGLAEMLRRAQVYARNGSADTAWGVHVQSGSATLFRGATYASRNTAYDETNNLSTSITVGGLSDVVFSKLGGAPSTTGSFSLTGTTNDTRTVTINGKGMVSY
jgi:prepilin-type N-terminal cleavage/methylation domain-containing protein